MNPNKTELEIERMIENDIDASLEDWWDTVGKDAWGEIYGKSLQRDAEQLELIEEDE